MLESGQLDLSDEAFRQQAKAYPAVSPYARAAQQPCPTCASTIWRSGRTDVIAQYCQRLDRARGAINLRILNLYLALACGCAG